MAGWGLRPGEEVEEGRGQEDRQHDRQVPQGPADEGDQGKTAILGFCRRILEVCPFLSTHEVRGDIAVDFSVQPSGHLYLSAPRQFSIENFRGLSDSPRPSVRLYAGTGIYEADLFNFLHETYLTSKKCA